MIVIMYDEMLVPEERVMVLWRNEAGDLRIFK